MTEKGREEDTEKAHDEGHEEPYEGYELLYREISNDPRYEAMDKEKREELLTELKVNPIKRAFMMITEAEVLLILEGDAVTAAKLIDLAERTVEKHNLNKRLFGEAIRDLRKEIAVVSDMNRRIAQKALQVDPRLQPEIDIPFSHLPFFS